MRENLRVWLKLLLLLLDEALVVFVVMFVIWKLGMHLHTGVLAAIAGAVAPQTPVARLGLSSETRHGPMKQERQQTPPCPKGQGFISCTRWKTVTASSKEILSKS